MPDLTELFKAIKRVAKDYRRATGRPLGVTGEIGEFEAARLLGLELSEVRQPGYDATRRNGEKDERLQIKSRCTTDTSKSQRVPSIKLQGEWDAVLLVILDGEYEVQKIYEAGRTAIESALTAPGSKSRNERGQLPVSKFRAIGRVVWGRDGRGR